jgi:hypothetical protein
VDTEFFQNEMSSVVTIEPTNVLATQVNARIHPDGSDVPRNEKKKRIYYIDWLRTWLTLLVVIHHCFWVVLAGWIPFTRPWNPDTATLVISYIICAGDQAYFMGLFFFLSGLVTGPSLKRKGPWEFLKDRFYRLIVPAIVYDVILYPLLYVFLEATWYGPQRGSTATVGQVLSYYFANYTQATNHMWFTVTLFWFHLMAVIVFQVVTSWERIACSTQSVKAPTTNQIMLQLATLSFVLFVTNFLFRIFFGYTWIPVVANLAYIWQYAIAFALGIYVHSYQLLDHCHFEHYPYLIAPIIICFWAFLTAQIFLGDALEATAGFHVKQLLVSLFEQTFAVFFAYFMIILFKKYFDQEPKPFVKKVIHAAYATYIMHQWVVIPIAVAFAYTNIYPLLVILLIALFSCPISWGVGLLMKMIPGAQMFL